MKSHEILDIKEAAIPEEIESAYAAKKAALDRSQDILSPEGYVKKLAELDQAKKDCLAWKNKSKLERLGGRLKEASMNKPSDVRLYTPCIGPVTLIDGFCGYCCDITGTEPEHSLCEQACNGSQACPICLDVGVWGFVGLMIFLKWKEKHEAALRVERRERANRAQQENVHLDAQLGTCKQEEAQHREKIQGEQAIIDRISAFSALFTSLGANPATPLIEEQNKRISAVNQKIDKVKSREEGLRSRIRENDRLIAEANSDT